MVKKLAIIREIFKGDHDAAARKLTRNQISALSGTLNYLHKLCDTIDLVDIWKLQNPESVRYTRREKTKYGLAQSRIDFFLISSNLEYTAKSSDILTGLNKI